MRAAASTSTVRWLPRARASPRWVLRRSPPMPSVDPGQSDSSGGKLGQNRCRATRASPGTIPATSMFENRSGCLALQVCEIPRCEPWTGQQRYRFRPKRFATSSPRRVSSRPKTWLPIRIPDPIQLMTAWSPCSRIKPTIRSTKSLRHSARRAPRRRPMRPALGGARCAALSRRAARVLFWLLLGLPHLASGVAAAPQAVVLQIDGAIGPAVADYVVRELRGVRQGETRLVVLRMNTPGGLDTSMREIVRAILSSSVPVATYVAPSGARAASAGTYIAYASAIAAMAPGTNLGAATPIR